MPNILDSINSPDDIKKLSIQELEKLSGEVRQFLIEKVSKTGGHLASNLGVVELTLALHYVFNTPEDKIIWDVGHQSYVHKIITGRKEGFDSLRKFDGISGFPKVNESVHDCFNTGHSSTSISAGLGIARARDIKGCDYKVISLIGDGALTGGMAFEALNDAGRSNTNFIVVLNDNEMSISKNVGGLSRYLSKIRTEPFYFKVREDIDIILNKIPAIGKSAAKALNTVKGTIKYMIMPGIIFEELGFKYLGPINGHDINELNSVFSRAKNIKGPVFIHVCTQKGKGYAHAEENPRLFHGISPFEIETGEVKSSGGPTYSDCFGKCLVDLAKEDKSVVAITAAMPNGTGLDGFSKAYPERFFDAGIAEQHAVTYAAGMAINGFKPVFAVYSSFLQRAYDQILHDVALQNLHVVFAIDRAGIVGEDGETHQGVFDLSFLGHIPNMTVMAPADYNDLRQMLRFAVLEHTGPVAIRYPRGRGKESILEDVPVKLGQAVTMRDGNDASLLAVGSMVETAIEAADILMQQGIKLQVLNMRFIRPIDENAVLSAAENTGRVFTLEDNILAGGFGDSVLRIMNNNGAKAKFRAFGFPDTFITQGSRNELLKKYRLDPVSISEDILYSIKSGK